MEDDELDDTVIAVPHPATPAESSDAGLPDDDTVVRIRVAAPAPIAAPVPVGPPPSTPPPVAVPSPPPAAAIPQPVWYHIRVGSSDPIVLDAPVYVGRRPALPRVYMGATPRLVTVPSPRHEVSGTHVRISQQGSSVVVTDEKSTNSTVVRIPGAAPLKLRQGESVVVIPGTMVDIGDGNRIEILPTQRLTQ